MKNPFRICPFCDSSVTKNDFLCPKCREAITQYRKTPKCVVCGQDKGKVPLCDECDKKLPPFRLAVSCYYYDGAMKEGDDSSYLNEMFRDRQLVDDSPSKIADKILRRAKAEIDSPTDDISVIVVKVKKEVCNW